MDYPFHQPIDIATGAKSGDPCRRDGVFVDVARSRADILIMDERASFDPATQVATDTEVAEPWPFDPAQTKWKKKRAIRAKTAQELADDQEAVKQQRVGNLSADDLITVLTAIVNEERTNRGTASVAAITKMQFISYCRTKLGIA